MTGVRSAEARCFASVPRAINVPYVFVDAFIDSLAWAQQGDARFSNPGDDPFRALLLFKQARDDYRCAADEMSEFMKSTDPFIGKPAQLAHMVYYGVSELLERAGTEWAATIDQAAKGVMLPGSALNRMAEVAQQRSTFERQLLQVAIVSTYSIIEFQPDGTASKRLRIGAVERQQLMQRLEGVLGPSVRGRIEVRRSYPTAAGAAILTFLADQKWLSR
jgi:hypothetical protein